MARLVGFHYQLRASAVHRLDPRFKLPLFLLLVTCLLHSGAIGLAILSVFGATSFIIARLPVGRLLREFRSFGLLLAVMFLARSFGSGSSPAHFTQAGLLVWRLSLLLLLGLLLAMTTPIARLQAAVAWYLRPLPHVPGGRIATMVGLTLSLIPLVFDTYREISDAQAARCLQGRRNPLRRLRLLVLPLMLKTFGRADHLAEAMESRCYSDERTFVTLTSRRADWLVGLLVAAVALLAPFARDLLAVSRSLWV